MNSLRLLIVDDEPLIRAGIRHGLDGLPSVSVAGECGSVAEAVETIRSSRLDLVLLDVQLPDGTGFDVISQVGPQLMPPVVFLTAYDTYALRAFAVNAVDYLLKPFDDVRLRESIGRVRDRLLRPAQAEMESARSVQERLFPRDTRPLPGVAYAGRCAPARNVSGDYYDFLPLGGNRLGLVLADVSGKGVPAALLMASLRGSFRTHAESGRHEPVALLRSINRLLYESTTPETYATVFFGDYDSAAHRLCYVNCGHLPPFLLGAAGGDARRLEPTATVLGAFPVWDSGVGQVDLSPGDTLFAYTDGLTEARSPAGEEFGDARLVQAVIQARSETPASILERVVGLVQEFSPGAQEDDMTAVVLQRSGMGNK